jgi:hypothetical protein
MHDTYVKGLFDGLFSRGDDSKNNFERDVLQVRVEACECSEDPLGYKAVFISGGMSEGNEFVVGASFLAQRRHNLVKKGYFVPMTNKAIALIEGKLGRHLPVVLT